MITSVGMFFNEGVCVISCADGWYISVFDSSNARDNAKVHDIIKVEKDEKGAFVRNYWSTTPPSWCPSHPVSSELG